MYLLLCHTLIKDFEKGLTQDPPSLHHQLFRSLFLQLLNVTDFLWSRIVAGNFLCGYPFTSVLFLFFSSFRLIPFGVAAVDHLSPSHCIPSILVCDTDPSLIHKSYLSSSSCWQLRLQHPLSKIFSIPPLHKPSQLRLFYCVSILSLWYRQKRKIDTFGLDKPENLVFRARCMHPHLSGKYFDTDITTMSIHWYQSDAVFSLASTAKLWIIHLSGHTS